MSGREELRALVEALKPFAEAIKGNLSHQNDTMPIVAGPNSYDLRFTFKLGDFRRARTAVTRAESSLASPAGMEGWMPIARYDKERGEVAVLLDWFTYRTDPAKKLNPVRYVGYWSEEYGAWFDDDGMDLDIDPTHFMPLAALPAAPRGEAE